MLHLKERHPRIGRFPFWKTIHFFKGSSMFYTRETVKNWKHKRTTPTSSSCCFFIRLCWKPGHRTPLFHFNRFPPSRARTQSTGANKEDQILRRRSLWSLLPTQQGGPEETPVISGVITYNPHKWPNINGFPWGYKSPPKKRGITVGSGAHLWNKPR